MSYNKTNTKIQKKNLIFKDVFLSIQHQSIIYYEYNITCIRCSLLHFVVALCYYYYYCVHCICRTRELTWKVFAADGQSSTKKLVYPDTHGEKSKINIMRVGVLFKRAGTIEFSHKRISTRKKLVVRMFAYIRDVFKYGSLIYIYQPTSRNCIYRITYSRDVSRTLYCTARVEHSCFCCCYCYKGVLLNYSQRLSGGGLTTCFLFIHRFPTHGKSTENTTK